MRFLINNFLILIFFILISIFPLLSISIETSSSASSSFPWFSWIRNIFGNYEEPDFTILKNITEDVQMRSYPSQIWVCVDEFLTEKEREKKKSKMFMDLYSYSQGENEASKKVPFTIPISTKIEQIKELNNNGNNVSMNYEMCFFLGNYFQSNQSQPKPTSINVRINKWPHMIFYVKTFGGYANSETYLAKKNELIEDLNKAGIKIVHEEAKIHYENGYDTPTKFWGRRNEIWIPTSNSNLNLNSSNSSNLVIDRMNL